MLRTRPLALAVRRFSLSSEATREKLKQKIDMLTGQAPLTHQTFAGRKRFYKKVGVKQIDNHKASHTDSSAWFLTCACL